MKMQYWLILMAAAALSFILFQSFKTNQTTMLQFKQEDYEKEWQEIDSLENEGLPKSALEKVEKLRKRATEDNNTPQLVKTILYEAKYKRQLEAEGETTVVEWMEAQIAAVKVFPVQQLLASALADYYNNYLQENYWRFTNRTEIVEENKADFRTWSIEKLITTINELYITSLEDERLKQIPIQEFKALLIEGKEDEGLRPTLYDLLAHRALAHFKNDRSYLTQSADQFYINDVRVFAPANEFANIKFNTKDSTSFKLKTLSLFQNLIAFHLKDEKPEALLDANLMRLKYVHEQAIIENKDQLYISALDQIIQQHEKHPMVSEAIHLKAQYYYNKGLAYNKEEGEAGRWDLKTAVTLCESAIQQFPTAYGSKHCQQLLKTIQNKELTIQLEQVNLPNQPFLVRLNYRNLPQVYFKLVNFSHDEWQQFNTLEIKAQREKLKALKPVQQWSEKLSAIEDFHLHHTEAMAKGLPLGSYVLIASEKEQFDADETSLLNAAFFAVSELAYWHRGHKGETEFFVVNRATGEPLKGVTVELYKQDYDRILRQNNLKKLKTMTTDQEGYANVNLTDRYFQVKFIKEKDVLFFGDGFSNYNYNEKERSQIMTHFFLDRAIYRPGQTVYFKAIVLSKDEDKKPSLRTNEKVVITLYDVNSQRISDLHLTTNEYGTVQGSFVAPSSGLFGRMRLSSTAGNSSKYFSVEEYKRPTFEVKFEPVKEAYRLEEMVTVNGLAQALAGNNIDQAKVQYRVVREVRYPWLPWWRGYRFPRGGNSTEITNGTTTTDEKGQFAISFKAMPDYSADAQNKPEFHYTVYADVTDIAGETRSTQTSVTVGYIALNVQIDLPEKVELSALNTLMIKTQNLNGEFEAAKGTISIQALEQPKQVFLSRYWSKPDQYLLTAKDYQKHFPHFAYGNEDEIQNWKLGKTVFDATFNTAEQNTIAPNLKTGGYVLILKTTDKYGTPVELRKYFTVFDVANQQVPFAELGWQQLEKSSYEPSETARVFLGSRAKLLKVLFEVEKNQTIVRRSWVSVNDFNTLTIPIEEEDRGNIHYYVSYVYSNRAFHESETIVVPWSNKELKIEYSTFRSTLKPGEEEEWRIKISGPKKEKVAAEMVATLYDASLEQFATNSWNAGFNPYPTSGAYLRLNAKHFNSVNARAIQGYDYAYNNYTTNRNYTTLNWFGWGGSYYGREMMLNEIAVQSRSSRRLLKSGSRSMESLEEAAMSSPMALDTQEHSDYSTYSNDKKKDESPTPDNTNSMDFSGVYVRKNLNETVFFLPNLKTDAEGNIIIKFKMNEALTRWRFLGFAHTKDLKFATTQNETMTQKELMVQPNAPRFLREGDNIVFTAKVSNMTEALMNGTAQLELLDATTMQPVHQLFGIKNTQINFQAKAGQSSSVAWSLKVPSVAQVPALVHRVVAQAGDFADGEESVLPILTNRMLVTESLPLPVRGKKQGTFTLASLQNADKSNTLEHQSLTLEFTSNPAWYAVQSLPYLMEYPYQCIEQVFNRYYANALATSVANAHPRIKTVFDTWASTDAAAMQSNLAKNEELKYALLQETPWVLNAQSEEAQKRNIGLLFDLNRMAKEQEDALKKIAERQLSNGGFSWFEGGNANWYMTQYILEGIGHLDRLKVRAVNDDARLKRLVDNAIQFIDEELVKYYEEQQRNNSNSKKEIDELSPIVIHYLYTRSFFLNYPIERKLKKAVSHYTKQAEKYWLKKGIYQEGMIALALQRMGETKTPTKIVKSLKERAIEDKERGMYWKTDRGYDWYQLPIESHALMIEVFSEVAKDMKMVEELKVWLLKAKQTTHWTTTKATAAAVYALLMNGDNWLLEDQLVEVNFDNTGNPELHNQKLKIAQQQAEAGTGYFKAQWSGKEISADMATVKVSNPNKSVAWGGIYWQYFEQLDKIKTFEETPLKLKKQLFKEVNSPTGPKLEAISSDKVLQAGDKVKVRIELRVDRAMSYVHMKDTRASGFEPTNVLSQYKWQGGLGYYESTGDAATNFFFDYLPTGTHVFEYAVRVAHAGDFSNGITTIQCMYAPEFTSHSEGIRVKVK